MKNSANETKKTLEGMLLEVLVSKHKKRAAQGTLASVGWLVVGYG